MLAEVLNFQGAKPILGMGSLSNIIRKIVVDTKYVVKTYPSDVNEQLKKFVGEKLEFDEVKNEENS